jgi:hypothetical protein
VAEACGTLHAELVDESFARGPHLARAAAT